MTNKGPDRKTKAARKVPRSLTFCLLTPRVTVRPKGFLSVSAGNGVCVLGIGWDLAGLSLSRSTIWEKHVVSSRLKK